MRIVDYRQQSRQPAPLGPNPFDNMAIEISADGYSGRFSEWNGSQWVWYEDLRQFDLAKQQPREMHGKSQRLSYWYKTYDWIADEGYKNFSAWIG